MGLEAPFAARVTLEFYLLRWRRLSRDRNHPRSMSATASWAACGRAPRASSVKKSSPPSSHASIKITPSKFE